MGVSGRWGSLLLQPLFHSVSQILDEGEDLGAFCRSVSMPKEAFEKALSSNISSPFVAVFRFHNMTKDEKNSTLLGNEIIAIEMGTGISNLTDKINISFQNVQYEGIPSCHSWNGQGSKPNWTDNGCVTVAHGDNVTCQCSHLTFFAVLLTLNETISSSDLNRLTIITQVGCSLSMLFLAVVLFMHFLLRKTKAVDSITLLIHLVLAVFFLDLTFLVNHHVESLDNSVGCKIMAAAMHYFLLATFMWFATQAFHLCLQLTVGGKVNIRHYLLRVSICSWGLPLVVVVALLSVGRYGAQDIDTSDTDQTVTMCWITDSTIHWVVNIGCYALVFLFTFTTFIIMLTMLTCHKKANSGSENVNRNSKSAMVVFGLCTILGVSWGFVFFAYGARRIPAYYIFTILSSFQGFLLFVYYYYHTRHQGEVYDSSSNQTTNTFSTTDGKVS
ncbi:adhesion G-protein coupled receptor G1-like [Nelusetta ayraudi]|uniref:adhesion G-protein coupled receptor G1-like n=1 Tax=Nelusetta ayraudi TaxID=303726 RepID=UPI003F6EE496